MNPLHLLLNPLVLMLAIGLFLVIIATTMAWRIKSLRKRPAFPEPDSDCHLSQKRPAINPSLRLKLLFSIPLVLLVTLVAFVAYIADQMLGVVAFTYGYLAFCLLAALAFGGAWHTCLPKSAPICALVVFGILVVNFLLPAPSERLLRFAMLKAPPGTNASAIVDIVKQQYEGSHYAMPQIYEDKGGGFDRVHVSLLSQRPSNCTAVIFLIENGKVSESFFSPD
jgi:hypothetical protein